MSPTTQLPFESIGELADRLPASGTQDVTIEVINNDIGDQIQVRRRPWHALIYDQKERVLELSVGARGRNMEVIYRHEIHNPTSFWVEEDAGLVRSMRIDHEDGTKTIVRFFEREALETGS